MTACGLPFVPEIQAFIASATGLPPEEIKVEAPPRPDLGDFAVGCFAAAKRLGRPPQAIATDIAAAFVPSGSLTAARAVGPFVNLWIERPTGFRLAIERATTGTLLNKDIGAGRAVCIDYSSPNISKHLAFHHIRSTCIGHSLAEIFRALGYRVIGINHLGDWGTTHGMLLAAAKTWGVPSPLDVTALGALYVRFREAIKVNPALESDARQWFKRLEDGDAEARQLWSLFRDISWAEFAAVYDMLGIRFDEVRGESAYEADMPRVLAELRAKGLVEESDGAQVVMLDGESTPLLLVTKDGTTLYATRDIAAAEYRWNQYQFDRSLYVVDRGQSLHFRQLFKTLTKAGHEWASRCQHVPFGLIRFAGRKTGSREGNVVLLRDVFAEAASAVRARIAQNHPELAEVAVEEIAQTVGVGAVVFANLASQRDKDIDFNWEKAISLEGDSGPYLMYSHARCASILAKAGVGTDLPTYDPHLLTTDAEWAVARRIFDFGDTVARAATAYEPHVVAHYLLELAGDFSRWYTAGSGDASLRVLCDDAATRAARIALTQAVKATLAQGLAVLGVGAPPRM